MKSESKIQTVDDPGNAATLAEIASPHLDEEDAATGRPLAAILADIENGISPPSEEQGLITRLAAHFPPRDGRLFLAERDQLIREIVAAFAPPGRTASKVRWLRDRFAVFTGGPDWRATRTAVLSPFRDPERTQLWRLAQFGALPRSRWLWEIVDGA